MLSFPGTRLVAWRLDAKPVPGSPRLPRPSFMPFSSPSSDHRCHISHCSEEQKQRESSLEGLIRGLVTCPSCGCLLVLCWVMAGLSLLGPPPGSPLLHIRLSRHSVVT